MSRCREVLEQAYLYLDHEGLGDEERHQIQLHLEECGPCYERVGLDKEVAHLLARLRGTQHCPDALKTRILSMLEEV